MTYSLANPIKLALVTTLVALFLAIAWTGNTARADDDDDDFVGTENLLDGAVTEPKIADGAVTTGKIGNAAVTNGKIADSAITSEKLTPGAVGSDQIGAGAVGSGKLAEGAVTDPKIGPAAVTNGKIADGAVTSGKLATGAVGAGQIGDGAVGSGALAEGAVTTGKLAAGAVTLDKLDPGIELGGSGTELLRTIVVSPVGPTVADNCDELLATLDGITDNSQENPYLIKIEPGVYDCGATQVIMKPSVDMEGSGTSVTTIVGNPEGSGSPTLFGGVVVGADNSELRRLTVEHTGGTQLAAAVVVDGTITRITDIDVRVDGTATGGAAGIVIADTLEPSLVSDVRVFQVAGFVTGIIVTPNSNLSGTVEAILDGVVVRTSAALSTFGAQTIVRNSVLAGSVSSGNFVRSVIVSSLVTGPVGGNRLRCYSSFNNVFEPLGSSCRPLGTP